MKTANEESIQNKISPKRDFIKPYRLALESNTYCYVSGHTDPCPLLLVMPLLYTPQK